MTRPSKRPSPDLEEPGLDIFQMAGASISGWLPCAKTGSGPGIRAALPYATTAERDAALWATYNPLVAYIQRADVKPSFVDAHRLGYRLPVPFVIPYEFGGGHHEYHVDWVGVTTGGKLFGVEASIEELKNDAQSRAKLATADAWFRARGGWFGLYLRDRQSPRRIDNLLRLNAHRRGFTGYDELRVRIEELLEGPDPVPLREVISALAPSVGERRATEAAWCFIAESVELGRLLVVLDATLLDLETPVALLPDGLPAILPPALPTTVNDTQRTPDVPVQASLLPGATVDPSTLDPERRAEFDCRLNAVLAVLAGEAIVSVAARTGMSEGWIGRLVRRSRSGGEAALVPFARQPTTATKIDPAFIEPIRKLLRKKQRLSITQIIESPQLKAASRTAHEATGVLPTFPTYSQVWRLSKHLRSQDPEAQRVEAGVRQLPRGATSTIGFVRSIASPALMVQVDEHVQDLFIVTDEGLKVTDRVHSAVMICVKTAAMLGAVHSPRALTEEDYLRLVKQAMEPKDTIAARAGCINPWPCFGRPAVIMSDRGRIFISKHATDVVVDRFGITEAVAPPYAPSAKGTVEALFRWVTERFTHRLEGTTKSDPDDRGLYDSQGAALREGLTFTEFEALFTRAIVDGYMQDWDRLRGGPQNLLWQQDVERFGVPQYLGTADELKLLLMRAENPKSADGSYLVQGGGLSFKGNWYVGEEGLTKRLRGQSVSILWDRRDISTIYLANDSGILGAAHCLEYDGRRVSLWEQDATRRAQKAGRDAASATSSTNLTGIVADAQALGRERKKAARARKRAEHLDSQVAEIHPPEVLETRRRMARERAAGPAWLTDPSLLPGPDDTPRDIVVPLVKRREGPR